MQCYRRARKRRSANFAQPDATRSSLEVATGGPKVPGSSPGSPTTRTAGERPAVLSRVGSAPREVLVTGSFRSGVDSVDAHVGCPWIGSAVSRQEGADDETHEPATPPQLPKPRTRGSEIACVSWRSHSTPRSRGPSLCSSISDGSTTCASSRGAPAGAGHALECVLPLRFPLLRHEPDRSSARGAGSEYQVSDRGLRVRERRRAGSVLTW